MESVILNILLQWGKRGHLDVSIQALMGGNSISWLLKVTVLNIYIIKTEADNNNMFTESIIVTCSL